MVLQELSVSIDAKVLFVVSSRFADFSQRWTAEGRD